MTPKKIAAATKLIAVGDRLQDVAGAVGVSVATIYRHFPANEGNGGRA
jgi:AcrR family transcriptional regulator